MILSDIQIFYLQLLSPESLQESLLIRHVMEERWLADSEFFAVYLRLSGDPQPKQVPKLCEAMAALQSSQITFEVFAAGDPLQWPRIAGPEQVQRLYQELGLNMVAHVIRLSRFPKQGPSSVLISSTTSTSNSSQPSPVNLYSVLGWLLDPFSLQDL
jgi:hypothetical protein